MTEDCKSCLGKGYVVWFIDGDEQYQDTEHEYCEDCKGTGKVNSHLESLRLGAIKGGLDAKLVYADALEEAGDLVTSTKLRRLEPFSARWERWEEKIEVKNLWKNSFYLPGERPLPGERVGELGMSNPNFGTVMGLYTEPLRHIHSHLCPSCTCGVRQQEKGLTGWWLVRWDGTDWESLNFPPKLYPLMDINYGVFQ